ncbi:hypothetical protein EYZ11_000290 [Aspergillus tanneri]|uniref:BZIP domain-containing protein n=1 Tax=Aspergillus tanneri TaxID=1220188 RepID=A0A4S3JXH7_9EURO|nr:uncharacterized protein ATNIH1004_007908 [Aspergillus tanneri]KAA8646475.1 hypothetical protein ATNIH1004_007908 [Aspergillus tanneri]THD00240.1 hypothetical protein EYZ11_000290 [Aspergillus tanneri]
MALQYQKRLHNPNENETSPMAPTCDNSNLNCIEAEGFSSDIMNEFSNLTSGSEDTILTVCYGEPFALPDIEAKMSNQLPSAPVGPMEQQPEHPGTFHPERAAEEVEALKASNSTKRPAEDELEVDVEEKARKRQKNLARNRIAASKCRLNKKKKTEQLEKTIEDELQKIAVLEKEMREVEIELQIVNAVLTKHFQSGKCVLDKQI